MEQQLAPFNARPPWEKMFTFSPAVLQKRIEHLGDFVDLMKQYDPRGKFVNDFMRTNILSYVTKINIGQKEAQRR